MVCTDVKLQSVHRYRSLSQVLILLELPHIFQVSCSSQSKDSSHLLMWNFLAKIKQNNISEYSVSNLAQKYQLRHCWFVQCTFRAHLHSRELLAANRFVRMREHSREYSRKCLFTNLMWEPVYVTNYVIAWFVNISIFLLTFCQSN